MLADMYRSAFLFVLVAVLAGCSDKPAASADAGRPDAPQRDLRTVDTVANDLTLGPPVTVKVATFNVHNFFDDKDDPSHADEVFTAQEVDHKLTQLGVALKLIAADVIALQEVENREVLDRLITEHLSNLGYAHVHLQPGNDPRGINIAVLSKFPLVRVTSHANDYFKGLDPADTKNYRFSRDCLEVLLEPSQNRRLLLVVNHLRANDWQDPALATRTREAQAKRVREIVDSTLKWEPAANLAVLGDLNDTPDSKTLSLIQSGVTALNDPLAQKPLSQRYTTLYNGDQVQIDYILATPGLLANLVAGSAKVDHGASFESASDHYPVSASFRLQ